jgi:hypothetical protein
MTKMKESIPDASLGDILDLMMSEVFLPWMQGLGETTLRKEITNIKEACGVEFFSEIKSALMHGTFTGWLKYLSQKGIDYKTAVTKVRVSLDDATWRHVDILFGRGDMGPWLSTIELDNLPTEIQLIKTTFRVSCFTDIRLMLSCGNFFRWLTRMSQNRVDIHFRITEHELLFHDTIQENVSSSMIGLYQGNEFLSSLALHNDNMTALMQSVRERYGQDMSNLQVLHVMCRKPPNNFFPKNQWFEKVQKDIRDMEQKNCSICARIFGGRPGYSDKCDICNQKVEKSPSSTSHDDSLRVIQNCIHRMPNQSLTMRDNKLYCEACRVFLGHGPKDFGTVQRHVSGKKHPSKLTVWKKTVGHAAAPNTAAGGT